MDVTFLCNQLQTLTLMSPCIFILLSSSQVDQGLQTGLTPGMKLEVCVRSEADTPYWVANIITTCGQLLLLRYEGYQDDRRADFWCDIMTADLHPLGWSRQHGKTMRAPEGETWRPLLFFLFVFFSCEGDTGRVSWCLSGHQTPLMCRQLTNIWEVGLVPNITHFISLKNSFKVTFWCFANW